MARISIPTLAAAVAYVQSLNDTQKMRLGDEIFHKQPSMLGAFLAQHQMGVSFEKMEVLLEILLVCFQAMKESGLPWPTITEDDLDRQMQDHVAHSGMREHGGGFELGELSQRYINNHPEKPLLAFVTNRISQWLAQVAAEETDKYVVLAAINLVNCIAFVAIPPPHQASS